MTKTSTDAHLDLLGKTVRDRVTGFTGTAVTVSFDLFGCIQAVVKPPINKDGKLDEGCWFDVQRLEVTDHERKMALPEFGPAQFGATPEAHEHGPAEKPRSRVQ